MKSNTRSRFALVAVVVAALIMPVATNAQAQTPPSDDAVAVRLPAGWSFASGEAGAVLRWRPPDRLPWGGAALEVRNDGRPFAEAAPSVSVTAVAGVVTEGEALRWQLQLSAPADYGYVLVAAAVPDTEDRAELASDDVPRRWLRRQATVPDSPVPLHELGLQIVIFIPEGITTATLRIPTSSDSSTEAAESLALDIRDELGASVAPVVDGKILDG